MSKRKYLIMGKNSLQEVVRHQPSRLLEVYTCQKNLKDPLIEAIQELKIPLKQTTKQDLTKMVDSESHQSFVAHLTPKPFFDLHTLLKKEEDESHSLLVVCDSIFDPQNFGTILRTAECFGAAGVIYSKNRGTDITPTVTKASVGASELVPLCRVSNLNDTIKILKKNNYWVVGALVSDRAENLFQFSFPERTVLILGSEGEGIQPLLEKNCDHHVYIPMCGQIDSLNVSQASAVFLSHYQHQYFKNK